MRRLIMTRLAELRRAADCCRDVVAHALEGIAAAGPGFVLVVAGDEVGADVADRQLGDVLGHAEPAHQGAAGAILETVAATQPEHPGVVHYLIHTYDYPPLAQRGLNAANKYAEVAPAAQHALHMPAHTYSMLGLWAQSVESNTKSRASAQMQAARLWPGATHPSEPHHVDFMEYALLQLGQEQPAKQLRDDSNAIQKLAIDLLGGYTGLAAIPARFALERQAWKEAAALEPRSSQFPQAQAITYFARAIGSARSGDLAAAQQGVDKLKELRATLEKANQSYWAEQVEVQILAASA